MDGIRVDERDLEPEETRLRLGVDQLGSRACEIGERGRQVVDLVSNVVHPRPALREEPADGRVLLQRREELDAVLSEPDDRSLDALVGDDLAALYRSLEQPLVRRDRIVEVVDRNAEMMDRKRVH